MDESMYWESMQVFIFIMRSFIDLIMEVFMHRLSMQEVIIVMSPVIDFIIGAFIGMWFIG
jgi:hypothetical protein